MASKNEEKVCTNIEYVYSGIETICNLDLSGAIGIVNFMEVAEDAACVVPEEVRQPALYVLSTLLERVKADLLALTPNHQSA